MSSLIEIGASIDARIVEARNEIAALKAARAALRPDSTRTRANRSASRGQVESRGRQDTTSSMDGAASPPDGGVTAPAAGASASGGPSTDGAALPTRRRARRRSPGVRQAAAVLMAGKLEVMLRDAQDGLSVAELVKSANARASQVGALLRELEKSGQVRRVGTGRGTRWRLITDEERVAERAAELEQRATSTV